MCRMGHGAPYIRLKVVPPPCLWVEVLGCWQVVQSLQPLTQMRLLLVSEPMETGVYPDARAVTFSLPWQAHGAQVDLL